MTHNNNSPITRKQEYINTQTNTIIIGILIIDYIIFRFTVFCSKVVLKTKKQEQLNNTSKVQRLVCTGVPPPKVCPCGDLTGSGPIIIKGPLIALPVASPPPGMSGRCSQTACPLPPSPRMPCPAASRIFSGLKTGLKTRWQKHGSSKWRGRGGQEGRGGAGLGLGAGGAGGVGGVGGGKLVKGQGGG